MTEVLDAGRRKSLEGDWDLGVIVTDLPLKVGGRPVSRHLSPTHGLAVLSLPALGPLHLRQRLRRALVELIGELTGGRSGDAWEDSVLRELTTDTARRPGGLGGLLYAPALVASHLRLLLGMVRANRPWRLAARLYGALVAALAVGAYSVVTSDVWRLAGSTGWWRLLIICVVSIMGTVAAIIGAHGLWERAPDPRVRGQVALFNVTTTLTVATGIFCLYLVLFALILGVAELLIGPGRVCVGARPSGGDHRLSGAGVVLLLVRDRRRGAGRGARVARGRPRGGLHELRWLRDGACGRRPGGGLLSGGGPIDPLSSGDNPALLEPSLLATNTVTVDSRRHREPLDEKPQTGNAEGG